MSKQRLRFRIALTVVWAAVTAVGCTKRDDTPFGLKGDAEVHLSVGLDKTENEQTITKAGQPQIDPYKDLAVYVINTHEDTLARWASFDAVPSTLKFTPGAYKVVAEYKPGGITLPAFEAYTYRAEEKFVIKSKDKLQIDLVAKLATTKLSVEFDPNFDFYYQSYSVDIRTVGVDSLRFAKGETRCGFFEPGSVRMRFNLVTPEGQNLVFSPSPLTKSKAADFYKLKLKVSSDQGGAQVIIIGTDDNVNTKKDTVKVPQYFLPKDKPTITPKNFVSGVEQSVFEGEVKEWSMKAEAPGGVSSFIIRLNDGPSGVLASKLGGETVIDLAGLPEDSPLRAKLRAAGFVWSAGLNSPDDASISTSVFVDFTEVMRAQENGDAGLYDFSFEVKDNYDQVPETDHPCVVKAEIKTSQVTFVQPVPGNIWATRAFFTVRANYNIHKGVSPVLQYKKTSDGNWNDAVEADGDVIVTPLNGGTAGADGFYAAQYELRGLQANTEYEFRVMVNDRTFTPLQAVWSTEQALAIPGLSADGSFAEGWNETASTTSLGVAVQAPPAGWATRNPLTTSQKTLSMNSDSGSGTEDVSEVSANNGTTLIPNPGNVYRKAVQLRTTGWGRGSYSKSGGDNGGNFVTGGGSPALGARVRNTSAAVLFLGTYAASPLTDATERWEYYTGFAKKQTVNYPYELFNGETITETGAAFASRPASLNFQYAFTPSVDGTPKEFLIRAEVYASDGTKIGGTSWNDGTSVPNMKNHSLKLQYTDMSKKAAVIKVFFSSDLRWENVGTPNGGPDYSKKTNGPHIGNVLVIDNVTLGYEFDRP